MMFPIIEIRQIKNSTSLMIESSDEMRALIFLWENPPNNVMEIWNGMLSDKKLVATWASESMGFNFFRREVAYSDEDCPPGQICVSGLCVPAK